ncbi:hypothetical protein [Inquilinus sp. Marseille-Q2685]|uniref:hypothetical protein n=1 Tax=Inquilinus sp. Marseille-Q2685 TaxID=2866581 RepID=UPI001CE48CBE|nr:hypothetical protein [Inquilinus sp. Marseille-Q2685]
MDTGADSDLDIQTYCRSLALQQVRMLTRLAEIAMQLAEAEGTRAVAAQARAAAPEADDDAVQAARAEAQQAGTAFGRFSRSVQRSLDLRSRAAADLCARDKADRRARRARQRNHVTEALYALIWDPGQETRELDEADYHTNNLHERLDALYEDEEDRIEDRPVGSVITGLACGLGLSDEWRRRAADWSGPPYPPPPTGSPGEIRARRRARLLDLMKRTLGAIDPAKAPGLEAGIEARLQEPDVPALIDAEPPARAAARLCRSLGVDFAGDDEEPEEPGKPCGPDTG